MTALPRVPGTVAAALVAGAGHARQRDVAMLPPSTVLAKSPLRTSIERVEELAAGRQQAQAEFALLRTERRAVHVRDDQGAAAAVLEGKTQERELPDHDRRLDAAAGLVTALGRELDAAMGEVDRARAEDTATAFAPLATKAEGLDIKISRLEAELDTLHTDRAGVVTALSWSDPTGHVEQPARVQVEAQMRPEAEERQRNEQARQHAAQADRLARQSQTAEEQRIAEAESEALAARQAALHG
jgi:hypothetical protein